MKAFWLSLILVGCSQAPLSKRELLKKQFDDYQRTSVTTFKEVPQAVLDFKSRKHVSSQLIYGNSVSDLDLREPRNEIEARLTKLGCQKHDDVIRNPTTKEPILYENKTSPMIIYVCQDGGMVRMKPEGDPTNKYRPWPTIVKAVRYPFNADYKDFDKEAFKVDNEGNALPKSPKDLSDMTLADAWAEDAHTDLK